MLAAAMSTTKPSSIRVALDAERPGIRAPNTDHIAGTSSSVKLTPQALPAP